MIISAYTSDWLGEIAHSFLLLIALIPVLIIFLLASRSEEDEMVWIVMFVFIPFSAAFLFSTFIYYLKHVMYKIMAFSHEIEIGRYGFGSGKGTKHKIVLIRNLRLNAIESFTKRHPVLAEVLFEYESHSVKCCEGITYSDGETLLKSLNELIRFHCQAVSCIVFGQPQFALPDETHFLLDPDVSELTMPFYHLDTLVILTESYNFMHIEQFLTYAVNHIGRAYLKRFVEAHIYGNIEKLHPNIRNNLTTFCKKTYFHGEEASFSALEQMVRD